MSIHVALTHRTTYRYDRPVAVGPQTIRLRPAPQTRTPILAYALTISPKNHYLNWQQDPQGNFLARAVFPEKVRTLEIAVDLIADMAVINPFDFFLDEEHWPFSYDHVLDQELAPYRRFDAALLGPLFGRLVDEARVAARLDDGPRTIDVLVALNQMVQSRVDYVVRLEPGVFTPEETLTKGLGSCRDSAWLLVHLLRALGCAARFCSGYLIQLSADVAPLDGPAGPATDFTDLHAWAEVYLPGAGWVGLDATSGLFTGEGHIPLAASPDPVSSAPISGMVEDAEVEFSVEMRVTRVAETPRTTKPYDARTWAAIRQAGRQTDRALAAGGVRLTLGGEPTFVAETGADGAEWNFDAMGPTKRHYAGRLLRRLAALWAPGAALHYGQGKQYPGEPIPRWALHAIWRADQEPVWHDPGLLASDDDVDDATADDALRFAHALAERLQVDPGTILPAREDVHYYLWREHRLPANVTVEDAKLGDPLERARLARVFGQNLAAPVGAVMPLRRDGERWVTGFWVFRSGDLFLIPGDGPMGVRLPLDSLPWATDAAEPFFEADPFAPRGPMATATEMRAQTMRDRTGRDQAGRDQAGRDQAGRDQTIQAREHLAAAGYGNFPVIEMPRPGVEQPGVVRTALCVEPRHGLLHVYLPPLRAAEDWLALVAAVEATAQEAGRKIVLEGYLPPSDPRLETFSVTPDPGVIEVNIHPSASWDDTVRRTEELYDAARHEKLAAEKFMLDGRHVGTGGGNHVVMGAADPADSPFLRRPDLLRSLVSFWNNHPSLSMLFSGLFIGPTSQHPRVDEARGDTVAELEIACAAIDALGDDPAPWMVDRILRNVLVDMTGSTHRTEFCIDKLYSPDGPGGRRGLVELRAFEMPPHAEMSVVQQHLVRAAVAAFWARPYRRRLVRWGTALHDRFMLPAYVERDFGDAIDELRNLGAPLDAAWFAPHFAFRFPEIGRASYAGVEMVLRHALEPWHVLGEEQALGGTARYVDSSAERVELRVENFVPERYAVACNGVALPMMATERAGEYVAGVRFKAWNPPSALHPSVPAQGPLVFDLWDRWSGRSVGGMAHHVTHPGGLAYDRLPVNAAEAETRRRTRFVAFGHTPGAMAEPPRAVGLEQPVTLDLRRFAACNPG